MALVMLPCDLPWWGTVQKQLKKIASTRNTMEMIDGMKRIHAMCNISLDPDDDTPDPEQFVGLLNFLDNEMTIKERSDFINKILPCMATRAGDLRQYRPKNGLHFSLQQQPDSTNLDCNLVASLIANAFFSTFPKRTEKTHPTLQNFNFCDFFRYLNEPWQKAKLRSILKYFEWLEEGENTTGHIRIMRQVMSSKEWLTIEDWLECSLPLCPLHIKHEGKLERAPVECLNICFASNKIGGKVLENGNTQESMTFCTIPEILCTLLNVEALEDNEVLTVDQVRRISRIADAKHRAQLEGHAAQEIAICCVDAEDYSKLPLSQFEEDNVLRELNKCLLAYQQKQSVPKTSPQCQPKNQQPPTVDSEPQHQRASRRLSPIGESMSLGSNAEVTATISIPLIKEESCSTNRSGSRSPKLDNNNDSNKLSVQLEYQLPKHQPKFTTNEAILNNRRGKFIVLGSSGECLPVKRKPLDEQSKYSSCSESGDDEFHSAKTSIEEENDEAKSDDDDADYHKRYSLDLETPERRNTFAERLREALRREASNFTSSSESGYAVGINIAGSGLSDQDIKVNRKGSTGFLLHEESLDEAFLMDSLDQERQWIDNFRNKQSGLPRKDTNRSSEYSFSTDYSSELEEVYDQFSRWLDDPILETDKGTKRKMDARDLAVVQFAGSILKRTLSESFAGVSLVDGCEGVTPTTAPTNKRNRMVLNAKSLSLELAKHKHRLAAQLSRTDEEVDWLVDADEVVVDESRAGQVDGDGGGGAQPNGDAVAAPPRRKLNWVATCIDAVVQTLEDICVNVILPQPLPPPIASTNRKLSQIAQKPKNGLRPIATGNWGCGSSKHGEVQLKVVIQWLAASVAGAPSLIYYTCGHAELASLDTLYRILRDRKWSVKDLAEATLRYSTHIIEGRNETSTLFDELIGVERIA